MFSFISIFYFLFTLICCAAQVTAAVYLLPEKGKGPWMLLVGAIVTVVGMISSSILPFLSPSPHLHAVYYIPSAIALLGSMISCAGLLLYALHRRGQRNRVAELEAIIASIQKS